MNLRVITITIAFSMITETVSMSWGMDSHGGPGKGST
jgi:hypothetical protein